MEILIKSKNKTLIHQVCIMEKKNYKLKIYIYITKRTDERMKENKLNTKEINKKKLKRERNRECKNKQRNFRKKERNE